MTRFLKPLTLLSIVFLSLSAMAQKGGKSPELFNMNGEPVTVKEFKYIYEKNNAADKDLYKEKSIRDYLSLYINFKMKVKAANDRGLDTSQEFLREFVNYRGQLAQPYLTDRQVTQNLIDEAYEHLKWELRTSHILITVSPSASPKDTMIAYKKAMDVYMKVRKGDDFVELAKKYSNDPSASYNGGDINFFTAFQVIYPFEKAAFALRDIGDISVPVRTQFGYHIIKLTGKRPNRGEVHVRHILISLNDKSTDADNKLAKARIDSIYQKLQKGEDFKELAKKYSDHLVSRDAGGELQWLNSFAVNYPEEFRDGAFKLNAAGDYTVPIKTIYGWHIIQLIEKKGQKPKKEMEEYIKQKISRDNRSEQSKEAAIAKFKKENNLKENGSALKKYIKSLDTTLLKAEWKPSTEVHNSDKVLFTIMGEKYTFKNFSDYLAQSQESAKYSEVEYAAKQYYKNFVNKSVYDYEDKHLEQKHEDFFNVAKEYKEGILLFDITEKNVWGKAMKDSVGQLTYYNDHKDKYRWKDRAEAMVFELKDKATAQKFLADIMAAPKTTTYKVPVLKTETKVVDTKDKKKGKKKKATAPAMRDSVVTTDIPDIIKDYQKKDALSVKMTSGKFEKGENKAVDATGWKMGIQDVGVVDSKYYIVKVNKLIPADYKTINEARGVVISDYQDLLEKTWMTDLKAKYKVVIHEEELKKLIK
ncbi:MAG: peptidylprolyl isomerase [Bacteroidetes bacterium]|nr:peptidylprolyl isomerase [Bacteroidota bacterium]